MNEGMESSIKGALVKAEEAELDLDGPLRRKGPPGISAPVPQSGVNHLAMNCVVPGLGSLVRGRKGLGAAQLALAVLAVVMLPIYWKLTIPLALGAWIWSIVTGIGFVREGSSLTWK